MFPESVTMWVLEILQHCMNKLVMNRTNTFVWILKYEATLNEDSMNAMTFAVLHSVSTLRIRRAAKPHES